MDVKVKVLRVWWMVPLLSVAALAAAPASDLRVVDAVRKGDKEAVRSLVQQRADVNAAQADGSTALAWAVHRDDLEMAELLIRGGANVNAENNLGVTPLSLACTNGSAAMVQKLVTAGANPNIPLGTGETPLMTCARTGNVEAVKSLLARGADANTKESRRGQNALMWAVAQKHAEVVRALVQNGADVHASSQGGFTPLLFAARVGDEDSARVLLQAGANVNEGTPADGSALVVASASGHEALARSLLERGADPNAADGNGTTALHFAALQGLALVGGRRYEAVMSYLFRPNMLELAKALLARGANPNARIAKANPQFSNEIGWFSAVGATPYLMATASNDLNLMRILVDNGADPLLAMKDNTTAVMLAAGMGRTERTEGEEKSAVETLKLVVKQGANVNAADAAGQTALHSASYVGSDAIVQLLVDNGAKVDVKDKYGMTPLNIAENIIPTDPAARLRRPRHLHETTANLLRKLAGNTPSQ